MKVKLEKAKISAWEAKNHATGNVRYALPFFISGRGIYFHRVRSANTHWRDGALHHVSIAFWCGNGGFLHKGRMYAEIPDDGILCATCEGRAIGAGLDGARIINGKSVMYQPKQTDG